MDGLLPELVPADGLTVDEPVLTAGFLWLLTVPLETVGRVVTVVAGLLTVAAVPLPMLLVRPGAADTLVAPVLPDVALTLPVLLLSTPPACTVRLTLLVVATPERTGLLLVNILSEPVLILEPCHLSSWIMTPPWW